MSEEFIRLIPKKYSLKKRFSRTDTQEILLRHGHIAITNYKKGDNFEFEKSLSVWDKISFKYRFIGGYYIKELKEMRINRSFDLNRLRRFFPETPIRVDNDAYPADRPSIELYAEPNSDFQRVAMTFMASQGDYSANSRYTQQMITASTGSGKTYLGIASTAFLSGRIVVIVPFSKLLKQWRDDFIAFTSVREEEILIVQGSKECRKIMNGEYPHIKVFIFMVNTIQSFVDKYGNMDAIDMFVETNAYIKIIDEVHRDIKALSMIEALCNFRMNYYMSASPGRTEEREDWIFSTLFRNMPKFGSNFETQDEKHINIIVKKYQFTPSSQQIGRIINKRTGMNTLSYETELLHAEEPYKESFEQSLITMLKWTKGLLAKDHRLLILAKTVGMLEYIQTIVEKVFPGETSLYHGKMKPKEKEEALKSTVIIATIGSLGTGANVKNLQHCYNCGTYSGKIEAVQTCGRLRKLKDPTLSSVYVEFVNYGWKKTVNQYEKRKKHLINRSKTGKIIVIE